MKFLVLIVFLIAGKISIYGQQILQIGSAQKLEVCNWNIEWFGKKSSSFGPKNKELQKNNIANVVNQTKIDVFAFQEVAGLEMFDSLILMLPNYTGVSAQYNAELNYYNKEEKTIFIIPIYFGWMRKEGLIEKAKEYKIESYETTDFCALYYEGNNGVWVYGKVYNSEEVINK
jgi:hypothetical protein